MSFDVLFHKFENGEEASFPRSLLDEKFAKYPSAYSERLSLIEIEIEPGHWVSISVRADQEITGFSVNRPPAAPAFWDAMYEILREAKGVLFWPSGDCGGVVADPETLQHLPAELREMLSDPPIASRGQDITDAIAEIGPWKRFDSGSSAH